MLNYVNPDVDTMGYIVVGWLYYDESSNCRSTSVMWYLSIPLIYMDTVYIILCTHIWMSFGVEQMSSNDDPKGSESKN